RGIAERAPRVGRAEARHEGRQARAVSSPAGIERSAARSLARQARRRAARTGGAGRPAGCERDPAAARLLVLHVARQRAAAFLRTVAIRYGTARRPRLAASSRRDNSRPAYGCQTCGACCIDYFRTSGYIHLSNAEAARMRRLGLPVVREFGQLELGTKSYEGG